MDNKDDQTFSADYVRELRQENAQWRTKLRDMENKYGELEAKLGQTTKAMTVSSELARRGIKANPRWVDIQDNQSPEEAVENFLKEYPQFDTAPAPEPKPEPKRPNIPGTPKAPQNTNTPPNANRSVMELKEDPVTRAQVRDQYRELLGGKNLQT